MIVIVKDGDGYVQVTDDGVTTTLFPNIDDTGEGGGGGGGGGDTGEKWTWDTLANNNTPAGNVSFKTATEISADAFYNRKGITSVNLTRITHIGAYAFAECSNITDMTNADDVQTIDTYAFRGCSKLGWLYFPKCKNITGGYAFHSAGKNGYGVILPALEGATPGEFMRSSKYSVCDLGEKITSLGTRSFYDDSIAYTIILRNKEAVVTAADTNRIPLNANTKIYVPSALVESYQTANSWSTAYSRGVQFLQIEGSQYEHYYADGTPIPTT